MSGGALGTACGPCISAARPTRTAPPLLTPHPPAPPTTTQHPYRHDRYYDTIVGTQGPVAEEGRRVVVHFEAKWKGVTFITSRQGMGVTGGTPLGFDVGAKPGAGGTLKVGGGRGTNPVCIFRGTFAVQKMPD